MPRIAGRFRPKPDDQDTWQYQVTPTAGYTHTPTIELSTGSPVNPVWDWGDNTIIETGVTMSHVYAVAGTYTVTVRLPNINWWMRAVDVEVDRASGDLLRSLLVMTRLILISCGSNALMTTNCGTFQVLGWKSLIILALDGSGVIGDIGGWKLPTSLATLKLHNTVLTGDVSSWVLPAPLSMFYGSAGLSGSLTSWVLPAGLAYLVLPSCGVSGDIGGWVLGASLLQVRLNNTGVSGSIAAWVIPATMTMLRVYSTTVSGAPIFTSAVALADFQYQDCALSQAMVDAILAAMWARRMSFTNAAPAANLGGTNANPSGVYADPSPADPTTGLEYKYCLVNDPKAEGFNKWAITT